MLRSQQDIAVALIFRKMIALCFRVWLSRPALIRQAGLSGSRCFASSTASGFPAKPPDKDSVASEREMQSKDDASEDSDAAEHEDRPPPSAEALAKKAASRAFQRLTTPPETLKQRGEAVEDQPVQTAVKWGKGKVKGTLRDHIRNPLLMRLGLGFGVLLPAGAWSGAPVLAFSFMLPPEPRLLRVG